MAHKAPAIPGTTKRLESGGQVVEIVSPKHEKHDLVTKPRTLHASKAPHYWILDLEERVLLVHRWSADGDVVVQCAAAGETVRAEPFDAIELPVGALFGDDEDDSQPDPNWRSDTSG